MYDWKILTSLLFRSGMAPAKINCWTIMMYPCLLAIIRADHPSLSCRSTFAFCSISSWTTSLFPQPECTRSGVRPSALRMSTNALSFINFLTSSAVLHVNNFSFWCEVHVGQCVHIFNDVQDFISLIQQHTFLLALDNAFIRIFTTSSWSQSMASCSGVFDVYKTQLYKKNEFLLLYTHSAKTIL